MSSRNVEREDTSCCNIYGHIPGFEVGQHFSSRQSLMNTPLHSCKTAEVSVGPLGVYSVLVHTQSSKSFRDDGDYLEYICVKPSWTFAFFKNVDHGEPIRVIRGPKTRSTESKFRPDRGYRYDGLYKVSTSVLSECDGVPAYKYLLVRISGQPPSPWNAQVDSSILVQEVLNRAPNFPDTSFKVETENVEDEEEMFEMEEVNNAEDLPMAIEEFHIDRIKDEPDYRPMLDVKNEPQSIAEPLCDSDTSDSSEDVSFTDCVTMEDVDLVSDSLFIDETEQDGAREIKEDPTCDVAIIDRDNEVIVIKDEEEFIYHYNRPPTVKEEWSENHVKHEGSFLDLRENLWALWTLPITFVDEILSTSTRATLANVFASTMKTIPAEKRASIIAMLKDLLQGAHDESVELVVTRKKKIQRPILSPADDQSFPPGAIIIESFATPEIRMSPLPSRSPSPTRSDHPLPEMVTHQPNNSQIKTRSGRASRTRNRRQNANSCSTHSPPPEVARDESSSHLPLVEPRVPAILKNRPPRRASARINRSRSPVPRSNRKTSHIRGRKSISPPRSRFLGFTAKDIQEAHLKQNRYCSIAKFRFV